MIFSISFFGGVACSLAVTILYHTDSSMSIGNVAQRYEREFVDFAY
nr:MAG TPA: hypothetical protein [Bacteriophage sp.]